MWKLAQFLKLGKESWLLNWGNYSQIPVPLFFSCFGKDGESLQIQKGSLSLAKVMRGGTESNFSTVLRKFHPANTEPKTLSQGILFYTETGLY